MSLPEPWLRGIVPGADPVVGHLLRSSQQIREEIEPALLPLSLSQLWAMPEELNSAGFHAKHLAGSTGRLCAYLEGRQLTPQQLAAIPGERAGTETAAELLTRIHAAFERYESIARGLRPEMFHTVREVGRQRLQTTAISLAIHIMEHGHRHLGQAIAASKLARAKHV